MEDTNDVPVLASAQLEVITPTIAEEYLKLNTNNRPINPRHLSGLVEQMKAGKWLMTYEPIQISNTNRLLNGQHRLTAIVKSGVTQNLLVIRGVDENAFKVMDTGRMRTPGDVLGIDGHASPRTVGAIIRMIINYERGNYSNTLANQGRYSVYAVSNSEIADFAKAYDMQPYVRKGKQWYNESSRLYSESEFGFFYFVLSKIDQFDAERFLSSLASGENLKKETPVFKLRKKLEHYRTNRVLATPIEKLGLFFKTWNLYRNKSNSGAALYFNKEKEDVPTPI